MEQMRGWSVACLVLATAFACASGPGAAMTASLDQQWWRKGVCYEVFVRSFADADGDGIGDISGLISHLDYINDGHAASPSSLGANCIWLMPIATATSYHGYDVTDYYHVDPHYGTDADFRRLMREAHNRGIHVIVDFVPNHSSSEHSFFQAALHDPSSPYRSWYRWSRTKPPQPPSWQAEVWHKSPVRDEYYYGLFWGGMPDLNYETPAVLHEMQKVAAYWLNEMHVDGFRFDAIPYLVEDGDQIAHTRGTHEVLRQFGRAIHDASRQSFTIGEVSDGSEQILATYYPDQLDAYFAFGVAAATVEAASSGSADPFVAAVTKANATFPEGRWSPFLTNHDQPRVMTVLGGDQGRARIAASAMLMLPGLPFIYYGEELGMTGTKPDEMIRTPMQWSTAPNAGFTTGLPWENLQPNWVAANVATEDANPGSLLNHYRRLIAFRSAHPTLSGGRLLMGTADNRVAAIFLRASEEETLLVALNFGAAAIQNLRAGLSPITPGSGAYRLEDLYADPLDACGAARISADGRSVSLASIAPHAVCVFRLARD